MISTHILDTSLGQPAAGVSVQLEKAEGENWSSIGRETTNADGRISFQCPSEVGTYRLMFQVDPYFKSQQVASFFTQIPVLFRITDTKRKYHVPLLLNPFGYSTYRGS
jgi:5-hydroxyisourate hydrolase